MQASVGFPTKGTTYAAPPGPGCRWSSTAQVIVDNTAVAQQDGTCKSRLAAQRPCCGLGVAPLSETPRGWWAQRPGEGTAYSRGVTEEPQTQPAGQPSSAVQRARADLDAGREWKARERLVGQLAAEFDAEALELLGEVNYAMRDLPAAGAAWFGTARRGKDVDEAVEAWRERYGDHFAQMWSSLPRSVREREGNKRVDALRRRAEQPKAPAHPAGSSSSAAAGPTGDPSSGEGGLDAATVIAVALAVLFVVCAVIGLVTVLKWVVPG